MQQFSSQRRYSIHDHDREFSHAFHVRVRLFNVSSIHVLIFLSRLSCKKAENIKNRWKSYFSSILEAKHTSQYECIVHQKKVKELFSMVIWITNWCCIWISWIKKTVHYLRFLRKHVHTHVDISKSEGGGDISCAYLNSARSIE